MRVAEIEALDTDILTCAQVASVIGADQKTLHDQAIDFPEKLGFRVIVVGSRVKIPKEAFVKYMRGEGYGN